MSELAKAKGVRGASQGPFLWAIYGSHTFTLSAWPCSTRCEDEKVLRMRPEGRRNSWTNAYVAGNKEAQIDHKPNQQPCIIYACCHNESLQKKNVENIQELAAETMQSIPGRIHRLEKSSRYVLLG